MAQPIKLIAKTNRIGLFQNIKKESAVFRKTGENPSVEEFNLHIDSSHHPQDVSSLTGKNIYTTGFVMTSSNVNSKGYSSGGSLRYHHDVYGSHVFELEGILDTLHTVSDYFKNHVRTVKINIFTDNTTVVSAYSSWVNGVKPRSSANELLGSILSKNKELLGRFELTVNWEKGHSAENVANKLADSIARGLRHEGSRYDNLTPLQMCGVISRVSRTGNQSAYKNLMNDYMFRLFTALDESAVLQINHSSEANHFIYKSYYRGKADSKFTKIRAKNIYEAMSISVEELRKKCERSNKMPKVYLVGSGFDGLETTVRRRKRTGLAENRKLLDKFYSNIGILFESVILLGGCCATLPIGAKVQQKHDNFVNDSNHWEKHKTFIKQHHTLWGQFNQLKY